MSEKEKFDVVLLSGGGIKGVGELGVLNYYYEKGLLDLRYVKEFVGTSIGSLISLLMVCGYSPMEIFTKVYTTTSFFNVKDFNNILEIFSKYGIMTINPLIEIVEEMVIQKFGKLPTLSELRYLTGKIFTAVAVNVNKSRVEYLNCETRPKLGAVDAVKMSCNLPIIFHKIKYDGDYWVDGGLVDSFPYRAVKNTTGRILGILVTGTDKGERTDTFINYLYRLIVIPMNPLTQLKTKNIGKNVKLITITFDNVSILNFAMETSKKMEMFMKGYHTAQRDEEREMLHIKGWYWDDIPEENPPKEEWLEFDHWKEQKTIKDGWDDSEIEEIKDHIN